VLSAHAALLAALQQFRQQADADLAASLQQELAGATARYQALKQAAGALDFADLLVRARDLIKNDAGVRAHLQTKFTRIFVDEFQDTDPVQAEILLLLADDRPGKLFIVGDPKQAIYRFRGTDVGTYWDVRDRLEAQGGRVLQLTTSYRSVPAIQRFVNAAFTAEMTGDARTLQSDYVPLSPYRSGGDSQPAIIALPVPKPYGRGGFGLPKASAKAIEASLPDAVGAYIAWLVEKSGWTVSERQPDGVETRVPVQPRHIAVLFRRFVSFGQDVTRKYIDAIEARGIPHLLVGGPTLHLLPIAEALRLLQRLHRARNYRPVAETIGRLLTDTRAHVGFILRPAGEQALANVLHVAELARQYEAGGGISFRGFIDELRDAASAEAAEAPILEEGSDGVRLMTVHKAKGLEFPVVILA